MGPSGRFTIIQASYTSPSIVSTAGRSILVDRSAAWSLVAREMDWDSEFRHYGGKVALQYSTVPQLRQRSMADVRSNRRRLSLCVHANRHADSI